MPVAADRKLTHWEWRSLAGVWNEAQALDVESRHMAHGAWEKDRSEGKDLVQEKERLVAGLVEAQAAAGLASVRAQEIELRALELRTELDHAHRGTGHAQAAYPPSRAGQ